MSAPFRPNRNETGLPRILIVRVGAMGDVLHGLPAVAALRRALPDAYIGWAIEPRWAALLQSEPNAQPGGTAMPLVDAVHPVETRRWSRRPFSFATVRSILRLRRALRAARYDLAIDLQGSIRSAVIARLSGARAIAGSAQPRERAARHLYTQAVPVMLPHMVQQATEIVSAARHGLERLAYPVPRDEPLALANAPLPIDLDAEQWCEAVLGSACERTVLLAPTAGWGAKEWPAERYGEVAARLHARGFRVFINASSAEDETALRVVTAAQETASPCKPQIVISTIPQLVALLRRVALVIAGDTGPLHLAAALERPVVALFGPTDPARNGPFATRCRVLRDTASVTDHSRNSQAEAGLLRIHTETVVQAAVDLLNESTMSFKKPLPDEKMKCLPEEPEVERS